jgi:hypothetical protein
MHAVYLAEKAGSKKKNDLMMKIYIFLSLPYHSKIKPYVEK